MAFRTVELTRPSEIHIKDSQIEITQEEGTVTIPIEDVSNIMAIGSGIRLSTKALSILSQNHVALTTLDEKYSPTAIVLPFKGNARQSQLIHRQVEFRDQYYELWEQIICKKISNQSRVLSILGLDGSENIAAYANSFCEESVDYVEAAAAKDYFQFYQKGLNRREDNPMNSRLNYGYAVVRSSIARALVSVGCHPAFGVHHNNQLNAFNLADDLIEPFRPMVDLVVYCNMGVNELLTKKDRGELVQVLHNACMVNGAKVNVEYAIELMAESYKRILMRESKELLALPVVLPIERLEGITE